jgi:GH15 family glucan-1,4-alpha-glucosidase
LPDRRRVVTICFEHERPIHNSIRPDYIAQMTSPIAHDYGLDIAIIGNGRTAALINPSSRIVWWCFPRFDGDPLFCRLLSGDDEKGFTDVVLDELVDIKSEYLRNTPIVSTVLTDRRGGAVRITDFAPRFRQFGRVFRPPQLFRIIEPIAGLPRITVRVRPAHSYGRPFSRHSAGSNHIRYVDETTVLRLTTDAPLSLITGEAPFVLTRPMNLVFGPDEAFPGDLETTSREFADRTRDYWTDWVRRLSISYDWQDAIIRAAITLKLSNFEETGGIIAAHTTSIPEAPGTGRTWDYRYCWLRDAYFVVKALNRIGATQTMEDFINFTLGIAANREETLRPVYGVVPTESMEERIATELKGYRGDGPVRIGNAAADQTQHDAYGSIILAAMPMFFDRRLPRPGEEGLFRLLESLGNHAAKFALQPDAGIWEYRGRQRVHTHSAAMCWAGCHRLAAIANRLGLPDRAAHWEKVAEPILKALLERAWNPKREAFTAAFGADELDASVLLLPDLGLVEVEDPRFVKTVAAMERELLREKHVMRYADADDFGMPVTAFLICRFWLVDAWWSLGRKEEARDLFLDALQHCNRYGLLSEDVDPQTGELWGNFPQTYSMAGLILTAMRLSRSWEDRYWRS